jgi:hypothetical protein
MSFIIKIKYMAVILWFLLCLVIRGLYSGLPYLTPLFLSSRCIFFTCNDKDNKLLNLLAIPPAMLNLF